jgi:putative tryptophan/tyrosine transport system substrate-binding protein
MRRRDLLAGLLATATASTLRAAEPNKLYRVAVCTQVGMDRFSAPGGFFPHFFDRMRQLGYIEGNNLIADRYAAENRPERYPEIARSAVQGKPDVIVVSFDNQLLSLVNLPSLAAGFVHNIARPEGNITGVTGDAGIEMQGKHLDILLSQRSCYRNCYQWTSRNA